MKTVILDCETTIFEKGNPFSRRNKLCYVGLLVVDDSSTTYYDYDIEYSNRPYGHNLEAIQRIIESADVLIGFNLKFDLHWIKRYINDISFPASVWDCQLAEFLLSNQVWTYPDLDQSLIRRGFGGKLDVVKSEYWDHGIDTPNVPLDTLTEYLRTDIVGTYNLYGAQYDVFADSEPNLRTLFNIQCADLLVLQEMEYNGMLYNVEESRKLGLEAGEQLLAIDVRLSDLTGISSINWNSSDAVSAVLYGGILKTKVREKTERILKDGTIKYGERWGIHEIVCGRLTSPSPGTGTSTPGIWSVSEDNLKSLKARGNTKRIIDLLLERAKLQKLRSTYYEGIPAIIEEKDWEPGVIHGQFNQCSVITGRLASSSPNLQNFSGDIKNLFGSRYE